MKTLQKDEVYRGRSYSEWIESWSNLLVSASPDYPSGSDMLFLRGNIDYKMDPSGVRFKEPGKFLDRTGNLKETIYHNTALFIPIVTALYAMNEPYEGSPLSDEEGLRYAVRKDISEGGKMWLRFKTKSHPTYDKVVDEIKFFYFETAKFTLNVSPNSPLVPQFEYPYAPSNYEAVQGGYFVILYDLSPDIYRFNFGGFGRGFYYTAGVYDIEVKDERSRDLPKDVSSENLPARAALIPQAKAKLFHLKIEDDVEQTSPF
jgi:hypothetical protein